MIKEIKKRIPTTKIKKKRFKNDYQYIRELMVESINSDYVLKDFIRQRDINSSELQAKLIKDEINIYEFKYESLKYMIDFAKECISDREPSFDKKFFEKEEVKEIMEIYFKS